MIAISDDAFSALIDQMMGTLPEEHLRHLKNVAITYATIPSEEQRETLRLRQDQTLFGLYEGVPLSQRQGMQRVVPDRITLFKDPLCQSVNTEDELKRAIRHTLWHEIAHYYGLDHTQIHDLEA